eukprot:5201789-Pleurochrysis_carterae.AAC.1
MIQRRRSIFLRVGFHTLPSKNASMWPIAGRKLDNCVFGGGPLGACRNCVPVPNCTLSPLAMLNGRRDVV